MHSTVQPNINLLEDATMSKLHLLTDATIRGLSTTSSHVRIADGGNLYLHLTNTGAKSWQFVWFDKTAHKQRQIGIGSYTGDGRAAVVSLKAARQTAETMRVMIREGRCPIEERVKAKVGPVTFDAMVALTIKLQKPSWKIKNGIYETEADWQAKITNHADFLRKLPVAIAATKVAPLLEGLWDAGKFDLSNRLRVILNMVFQTAISNPEKSHYYGANPADAATISGKLGKAVKGKKNKQPSLPYAQVPAAIAKLLATGRMDAKAASFATLTGARHDEARLMQWSEIDFDTRMWVVPSARMKVVNENDQGGDHYVPLSDAAIAILRSITPVAGNAFVFAGQKVGQPIAANALNNVIASNKRKGSVLLLAGVATMHGMRSSFIGWAKEVGGIERDVREMCIAHKVGETDTERSYDRAEMLDARRAALQAWGAFCRPAAKLALVGRAAS